MNYTLHQLKVFLKISQNQSITKTSEDLHLSQPAISIQLKNFQDQFSIPLTEQVGRRIYITDFGRDIAKTAENILNEVESINYKTNAYNGLMTGRLNFSIASTGKYVMPYFVSKFIQTYKAVDLTIDVTNKTQVVRSLENNEIDFALVSVLPDKLKINTIDLLPNQLYLVGSKNSGINLSSIKKLNKLPLIYREPGSATRRAMEDFIASKKITTYKKIELTSNEAVKQAVISGLGFSVMPLIGIKNELKNQDLEIIPIKGLPITTNWQLVWLQSKQLSPVAKTFLKYIESNKSQIKDAHFDWINQH
ncbi:LysR substrate-binding domain-containing protein [Psychroflexus aestuariivivens]|uniref:LysR substrate-binding domain-containing protein n=1 Tax=Psychroflexus aestuariivivens TaxID=1795040 RepID=UPI000FDBD53F|nr:LysR substrate-binding domain-containing protein [Psychroflexus aestuariivivens]